jgi:hypothetical protein
MTDMHAIAHRILTHDYPDMRERVRTACATLRDAVGSDGPESIESFAGRAAARIAELEARLARVREMAMTPTRAQLDAAEASPDARK